ncbi:MAG: dTMP kinase [bacterium]|nr:dTMP kinase [bacterium]
MNPYFTSLKGEKLFKRKENARFIVIEGIDGTGKTTQAKLLADELKKRSREVVLTKEPTNDTEPGKKLRRALRKEISLSEKEFQILFTEDRKEHLEKVIIPSLQKGNIAVSDRYAFSTIAYGSEGCDPAWLTKINENFPLPDLTLLIQIPLEESLKRIGRRGEEAEVYEEEEKLKHIQNAYKKLAKTFPGFKIIDGSGTIQETHKKIMRQVLSSIF